MTAEQKRVWDAAFVPRNEEFLKNPPTGKELVRWKYQRYIKNYLRCILSVDESVGRLLDYLDKHDLDENTIVVYSSDQGFYLGEHGWYDKRWMFEESLKMPFVIRWPGKIQPGTKCDRLIQNITRQRSSKSPAWTYRPTCKARVYCHSSGIPPKRTGETRSTITTTNTAASIRSRVMKEFEPPATS